MLNALRILMLAAVAPLVAWGASAIQQPTVGRNDPEQDFVEGRAKARFMRDNDARESWDAEGRGRESRRERVGAADDDQEFVFTNARGNVLETKRITDYKVLKDDQVVEIRNPRTGKKVITVMKATALPLEDMERYDLEYSLMELDQLVIRVDKHDEVERTVRVDWHGNIAYPLIGEVAVKGLTISQAEKALVEKFRPFVHNPLVTVKVGQKSPLARVLVVGKGFREFEGHEKILDILGSGWQPSVENIYDKICVIRKHQDGSFKCIVVDIEHMFKYYDFSQNIPLKAGDIIHVKKMPPLLGYRFKWWWSQVLGWMNEVDEAKNAIQSIQDFDLKKK